MIARSRLPLAPIAGAAVFAMAVAASAWRLWRLRYLGVWIDESDNVVVGWLLSEGSDRLYGTLFSHHMPLAYAVAHAVAVLSPSDDLAHFRLVPALAYAIVGFGFVGGPLAARAADRGWLAAALFVAGTAALAPVWLGGLLVTDVLWGCALVLCAASLWLPLCLARAPSAARALLGGAALAVWVSGSLVTVYPLVVQVGVLAVLIAISPAHRRVATRALLPAAAGAIGVVGLELLWMLRWADLSGFLEQGVWFNFRFYAPSQGFGSDAGPIEIAWRGVREAGASWSGHLAAPERLVPETWFAPLALVVSGVLGAHMAASVSPRTRSGRAILGVVLSLALLALAAVLRLRGPGFHAAPCYLWLLGAGAACVALAPGARSAAVTALAALAGVALVWPARAPLHFDWNEPDLSRSLGRMLSTFEYARAHTTPEQRFLSLNVEPLAYLVARRHPAHPAVFYLPWQAAWERSRAGRPDSCALVRANPPPLVYLAPKPVHGIAWETYGACFDSFVHERYESVGHPATEHLWQLRPATGSAAPAR